MSDQPVKVILDTSAIVAYTRGSIDVGEVIAEVYDEYAVAGIDLGCQVLSSRPGRYAGLDGGGPVIGF